MSQLVRKCVTRELKKQSKFPKAEAVRAAQFFSGTLRFISVTFAGGHKVPDADLATAIQHTVYSAPVIADYCSQYGPNTVNVDTTPISFTFNGTTFSDATLQNWVSSIAQAHNIPTSDCLVFLSPQGVTNTDAPISQGVLGYHGINGTHPYCFVNVLGTGLTVDDRADVYASALTHEIAEMVVDPAADLSNPEDSDSCSGNCGVDYRNYFDSNRTWLGGSASQYTFFTQGIATPAQVNACPSPLNACIYQPPGAAPTPVPTPSPQPNPCLAEIKKGITELETGHLLKGIEDIIGGIVCYFEHGFIKQVAKEEIEKISHHLHKLIP